MPVGWSLEKGDAPRFLSNTELATWAVDRFVSWAALQRAADRARREPW
jgi:hypothetical protein